MLDRFIYDFVGYGTLDAATWFVGLEEAGCSSVSELHRRIALWSELEEAPVVDLYEFHKRLGNTQFFSEHPKLQKTWAGLSRVMLGNDGQTPTRGQVREYQATKLGRADGETLLTELLPLPKQSRKAWPYAELKSELPCLEKKSEYRKTVLPKRIELLRGLISRHMPASVYFYGTSERGAWQEIAGVPLPKDESGYGIGMNKHTAFTVLSHPNSRSVTNEHFSAAGRRGRTAKRFPK